MKYLNPITGTAFVIVLFALFSLGSTLAQAALTTVPWRYNTTTNVQYPYPSETTSIGIGTTTPHWALTLSSSTAPQLSLTDASASSAPWNLRSINGNFYLSTSSPTTFATSSNPIFSILTGGTIILGNQQVPDLYCLPGTQCLSYWGSDNTSSGVSIEVGNTNPGTGAYAFLAVGNDRSDATGLNYAGIGLNSSFYAGSSVFGSAFGGSSLVSLQNSMGNINVWSASTSPTANVSIGAGGTDFTHETARFLNNNGPQVGIGSTSPHATLSVNAASSSPTRNLLELSHSTGAANNATTTDFTVASSTGIASWNVGSTTITAGNQVAAVQAYVSTASSTALLLEAVSGGGCAIIKDVAGTGYTQLYTQAGAVSGIVHTGSLKTCN